MLASLVLKRARAPLRSSAGALRQYAAGAPTYTGTVYKEGEKARENLYFSKADELALRKLIGKVKAQADNSGNNASEVAALHALASQHKLTLSPAAEAALLAWRHSHDF